MKTTRRCGFGMGVLLVGLLALPVATRAADRSFGLMTGASGLLTVSNETKTATTSQPLIFPPVREGMDLVLQPTLVAEAAGTSNVVFGFNLTVDLATFTTTRPVTGTMSCTGTNPTTGWIIISRTNLVGANGLRWDSTATTQTNKVTVSAMRWGFVSP